LGRVPDDILQWRQERLWRRVSIDEEPGLGHLADTAAIGLESHPVLRQSCGLVFDRQCVSRHPDGRALTGKTPFPIESPMPEAYRAGSGEHARGPQAEEPIEGG
jgi:hypothetical protein